MGTILKQKNWVFEIFKHSLKTQGEKLNNSSKKLTVPANPEIGRLKSLRDFLNVEFLVLETLKAHLECILLILRLKCSELNETG